MLRVIELDGGAVGGYAEVIYGVPFMPPVIHQLWVPRRRRRQGLGNRLLAEAIEFASRHGDEVLLAPVPERDGPPLEVLEAWYERHGFVWQPNRNMMALRLHLSGCVGHYGMAEKLPKYRCARCGEEFTAWAPAQRHGDEAGHGRIEWIIQRKDGT